MDNMKAFALGKMNRGKEQKVFDWDRAAEIIKNLECENASAGLQSDWEYTGGEIFTDGKPNLDDYTFLASTWATPELEIDGIVYECYKMQSEVPKWNSDTKWPESALNILKED